MTIRELDNMRGEMRSTPMQALSRVDHPDAKDQLFCETIFHNAPKVFLDPAILWAECAHETGGFTSPRWNNDLNPAGIGIVSDATKQPFKIPNAEVSAYIYLSMMNRLVVGKKNEPWLSKIPTDPKNWLDTVWARHCQFAPKVTKIKDLNLAYKYPDGDGAFTWAEDANYAAGVLSWAKSLYPFVSSQSTKTKNDVLFGLVPRPNILNMVVQKRASGYGYTALTNPRWLVGGCNHITDGHGTVQFYAEFFGINGERADDALVDFVIDRTGAIAMLNDPWGFRSPWANGGLDGLEDEGPAFLAKFGVSGVNNQLYSVEHSALAAEDWTPAEIASAVALEAWMMDGVGMRWDHYPVHQDYGIATALDHSVFTGKGGNTEDECAGRWYHRNKAMFQSLVRGVMKKYQTGSTSDSPVLDVPVIPGIVLPSEMTLEKASKSFGSLKFHSEDGKIANREFNAKGAVSIAWLARSIKEGKYPSSTDGWSLTDRRGQKFSFIAFNNGWVLVHNDSLPRLGWKWADD